MAWYLNQIYQHPVYSTFFIFCLLIWTLVWKGVALWYAGKHNQKGWFIAIFILNTAGLLPIIYILGFKPRNNPEQIQEVVVEAVKRKAAKKEVKEEVKAEIKTEVVGIKPSKKKSKK